MCFSFFPQAGLPVWGSYSFKRVASLGRMILPLSPGLHPTVGALGRMSCRKFHRQQAQRTLPPRNALGDPWRSVTPLEQLGSDIRQVSEHITIITSILADRPPQDILQRI